jgi:hypothetical protein
MTWTTNPTEPGWYWLIDCPGEVPGVARVRAAAAGGLEVSWAGDGGWCGVECLDARALFLGPLAPPPAPEA